MHSCLATDVWLGAATIELKRVETYASERMSDACMRAPGFCFVASVFTPLGDYCFSALVKRAGRASIRLRGKRQIAYSLTKLWRSALRRSKNHRSACGKVAAGELPDREGRYAPAAERKSRGSRG